VCTRQGSGLLTSLDAGGVGATQADAAICVAVLLACLGLCLAPRLLVVAVEQLVPHAALVACLAAAPLLMMVACSRW
jgi:hypothetical protein